MKDLEGSAANSPLIFHPLLKKVWIETYRPKCHTAIFPDKRISPPEDVPTQVLVLSY